MTEARRSWLRSWLQACFQPVRPTTNEGGFTSEMVCTRCGSIARPKRHTPGSLLIELLLLLFIIASLILSPTYGFIIPSLFFILLLIYGIWRLTARKWVCRVCVAEALVPIDSPVGQSMAARKTGQKERDAENPV